MSSDTSISVNKLHKCYSLYAHPIERLKQFFPFLRNRSPKVFHALRDINFSINSGEVLGIIGRNGAGKSTLLQLICNTLHPTSGQITTHGRISALLELGSGFNPQFTGRENIFLATAIQGYSKEETLQKLDDIIDFSGIRPFIDRPTKTYSSGMYVRLAFSVAINVDPDILVIDEALAVGDAEFSRKSFERIMQLKEAGKTILFCSHSLYQIESLCDRAIWLDKGEIKADGIPADVVSAYTNSTRDEQPAKTTADNFKKTDRATAYIKKVEAYSSNGDDNILSVKSGKDSLTIVIHYYCNPDLPAPSIAPIITLIDQQIITGTSTHIDNIAVKQSDDGNGKISITFPRIPLLKGHYGIGAYLFCEKGIHVYDFVYNAATVVVSQNSLEQGVVHLEHQWNDD